MDKTMEQKIIQEMKEKMLCLRRYSAGLRLRSALYEEKDAILHIEDELVDYLHYTKSILNCAHKYPQKQQNKVLEAMAYKERKYEMQKRKDYELYTMFQAIQQLATMEKELLFDYYIRNLEVNNILHRQGDIVESTMHRRLRKALLHLYELLQGIPAYVVGNWKK